MSNGYSKSFRVKVAKEAIQPEMKGMEEHIAKKYGIRPSTVERWTAIYREFGENGLGKKISSPTKKSDKEIQLEKGDQVRLRIFQKNGHAAWTSPVFIR